MLLINFISATFFIYILGVQLKRVTILKCPKATQTRIMNIVSIGYLNSSLVLFQDKANCVIISQTLPER